MGTKQGKQQARAAKAPRTTHPWQAVAARIAGSPARHPLTAVARSLEALAVQSGIYCPGRASVIRFSRRVRAIAAARERNAIRHSDSGMDFPVRIPHA